MDTSHSEKNREFESMLFSSGFMIALLIVMNFCTGLNINNQRKMMVLTLLMTIYGHHWQTKKFNINYS